MIHKKVIILSLVAFILKFQIKQTLKSLNGREKEKKKKNNNNNLQGHCKKST